MHVPSQGEKQGFEERVQGIRDGQKPPSRGVLKANGSD